MRKYINKRNIVRAIGVLLIVFLAGFYIFKNIAKEDNKISNENVDDHYNIDEHYNIDQNDENVDTNTYIRSNLEYVVEEASYSEIINEEDAKYIKEYLEDDNYSNKYSLFKVKFKVTNLWTSTREMSLNTNDIILTYADGSKVHKEVFGIDYSQNSGKELFLFKLEPNESIEASLFYIVEKEDVDNLSRLEVEINPNGLNSEAMPGGSDVNDYIAYVNLSKFISLENQN